MYILNSEKYFKAGSERLGMVNIVDGDVCT